MALIDRFRKKVNKANEENKKLKEVGYGYNSMMRQDGTERRYHYCYQIKM